ncbi:hypothetical protein BDV95DRAFT_641971 [Massariosphaeria phaeospora]|uniref:Aminoglycoside phosphotransferase domain-containing protein n=1 Tax=Massariosphaeria phaeospora TaxID=100035 RepID=A0A7C8IBR5_9PLEO|nr:hypothetical protein BDV95DRAFT_641971 [Massariosphaeria phaeospora]
MQTLHPENIPAAVSAFRPAGEVPVLNPRYLDGGQCRIFRDAIISILQGEYDVLQEIGRTNFPWAPKCHGASLTFKNLVGFPFIVLSWIEGLLLFWTTTYPSKPVRDKVLCQIAKIHMTLIECTTENRGIATQYFSRLTDNKLRRVRNGQIPGISELDCFDQKTISLSIIDWGFASKVPIQLAGRLPRFLQLSELVLPPSLTLQEDRKAYIASLTSYPSQAASWMLLIQLSEDVDFRHCVLESMISKGMHLSLARLRWNLPYRQP